MIGWVVGKVCGIVWSIAYGYGYAKAVEWVWCELENRWKPRNNFRAIEYKHYVGRK